MNVYIIDYGMGNLMSVKRAFEECGADDVYVCTEPQELFNAEFIVLPGVGSFYDGMNNLNKKGWTKVIREIAEQGEIPILGICLGMQLLASKGYEEKEIDGLGIIEGEVKKFIIKDENERIPHVGWNEVHKPYDNSLFSDIDDGTDFYFVHSYHFMCKNKENIIAKTPYCGGFISAISKDNVYGVQFHPEKSQRSGFKLIKNFLTIQY